MNVSKKILALVVALQLSGALIAKHEYVAINRQDLLHNSKQGKQLRSELETEARALQAEQQKMIAEVQEEEKALQKTLVAMNKPAQQDAIAKLQKKAKKIQSRIQEMTNEFNEAAEMRQKMLDERNIEVASSMLGEQEWGMLVDKNATLALNPDLDVTTVVLARLDEQFDASAVNLAVDVDSATSVA